MLDIYDELKVLVSKLNESKIIYALCGGLALAVYGIPRATVDIDLLIPPEVLEKARSLAKELNYQIVANPMSFAGEKIEIHRVSKVDPETGDLLILDFMIVTPEIQTIWESRHEVIWEGTPLGVVSREGLIALKTLRGSGQDQDDIRKLQEQTDEP